MTVRLLDSGADETANRPKNGYREQRVLHVGTTAIALDHQLVISKAQNGADQKSDSGFKHNLNIRAKF